MDQSVTKAKQDLINALRECENRIHKACLRGRDLTREIAQCLIVIQERELWRGVTEDRGIECRNFGDYVREILGWEPKTVSRYMEAEGCFRILEQAKLTLPENETQAIELARIDDERQPIVWQRVLTLSQEQQMPITTALIKAAVEQEHQEQRENEAEQAAQAKRKAKAGVEVHMSDNDASNEPDQISLSERGEEALARIRALCGDTIADSIREKVITLSEQAIRIWAEQEDAIVKEVPHYVVDKLWSVRKALNYISNLIDGDTTVDELILMARDRKGRTTLMRDDARISIEILMMTHD